MGSISIIGWVVITAMGIAEIISLIFAIKNRNK